MRALVVVPILALLLAGCSSAAPAASPTTVTVAAPSSAPPPTTTPTPSDAPTSPDTPQATKPCELPDLGVELSRPAASDTRQNVRVVWTNTSGRPCTMRGFGGADLQRTPSSRADLPEAQRAAPDRLSAARTDRRPEPVRLEPDERAHTTITFVPVPATDPEAFVPSQVLATPPDETRSAVLAWNGAGVLSSPGATGTTYLEPVRPGAS